VTNLNGHHSIIEVGFARELEDQLMFMDEGVIVE
jgi:ABC-type polar amino acid transport system ATPase subunit